MTLPKRPYWADPIPNDNFTNIPEEYTLKGPYWDVLVGEGLDVTPEGSLTSPSGSGSGNENAVIAGTWWPAPIGEGLTINEDGQLAAVDSP